MILMAKNNKNDLLNLLIRGLFSSSFNCFVKYENILFVFRLLFSIFLNDIKINEKHSKTINVFIHYYSMLISQS